MAAPEDVAGHLRHSHAGSNPRNLGSEEVAADRAHEDAPRKVRQDAALPEPVEVVGRQDEEGEKAVGEDFGGRAEVVLRVVERLRQGGQGGEGGGGEEGPQALHHEER